MNIAWSSVKSMLQMLVDSGHKLGLTNVIPITVTVSGSGLPCYAVHSWLLT